MRFLVMGGTVFLGRHFVSAALKAGHEVTTLNRGSNVLAEQAGVERLIADRHHDLSLLYGRSFDAVIDTCAYHPQSLLGTLEVIGASVGTYLFVSSISVYGEFPSIGINEEDPIKYTEAGQEGDYGSLKADCERVLLSIIPEKSLIVRPGLIAGPYDPSDRFTYWPARFARGGKILAPGKPDRLLQFIDVRDLAAWLLHLLETQTRGTFIATGPGQRLTMESFLDECQQQAGNTDAEMVWVEDAVLEKAKLTPWTELPLWIPSSNKSLSGAMRLDCSKARAAGLKNRPIANTIADTLAWDLTRDPGLERLAGLSPQKEALVLANPKLELRPGKGPLPGAGLS